MNAKNVEMIGNYVGQYLGSDINVSGAWRRFIRIRVQVLVSTSLKTSFFIDRGHGNFMWIAFKYEKMA